MTEPIDVIQYEEAYLALLIENDVPTSDFEHYRFENITGGCPQIWHNDRCKAITGLEVRRYNATQHAEAQILQNDLAPDVFWAQVQDYVCSCKYSIGASMVGSERIIYQHNHMVGKWIRITRDDKDNVYVKIFQHQKKRRSSSGDDVEFKRLRRNKIGRHRSIARFGLNCITGNELLLWKTQLSQSPLDGVTSFIERLRETQTSYPDLVQMGQEFMILRSLIYKRNDPNDRVLIRTVQVPFLLDNAPNIMRISWAGSKKLGKLDANAVNHVLVGGIPDTRKVQNALGGEWAVAQDLAQRISGNLMLSQTIYDNLALYTIGWIIWSQVAVWEMRMVDDRQLEPLVPRQLVEGALVCRSVRPTNAENAHNHFSEDLTSGRIVLRSDSWTDEDLIFFGQIASGLPRFDIPQSAGGALSFNCFDTPIIPFACYARDNRILPAMRVLSADTVRGSLIKLATIRGEEDQLVAGYLRASTLVYGSMMRGNGQVGYVTPMFEMHHIQLPAPADSNWMWRALGSVEASGDNASSKTDFELIGSTSMLKLVGVQLLLGRVMSVGFSIVLNHFNFGGEELTVWLGSLPRSSTTMSTFKRLAHTFDENGYVPIYRLAAHVVNELFAIRIPVSAFWGSAWNGVGTALLYSRIPNFRSHWGLNIPYLTQPLAISCLLIKWPSIWGFLAPPVKIDIKDEIIRQRPTESSYTWRPHYGTGEFDNKPRYVQCEYITLVLNAVWQHTGLEPNVSWLVKWPTAREWLIETDIDMNLQWEPHTGLRIGAYRSYFWAHNCQIAPEITWDADRDRIWLRLLAMTGSREEQQMGLTLSSALNQKYEYLNPEDYLSQILGSTSITPKGTENEESEN